jgi:hypothetical protein
MPREGTVLDEREPIVDEIREPLAAPTGTSVSG